MLRCYRSIEYLAMSVTNSAVGKPRYEVNLPFFDKMFMHLHNFSIFEQALIGERSYRQAKLIARYFSHQYHNTNLRRSMFNAIQNNRDGVRFLLFFQHPRALTPPSIRVSN